MRDDINATIRRGVIFKELLFFFFFVLSLLVSGMFVYFMDIIYVLVTSITTKMFLIR